MESKRRPSKVQRQSSSSGRYGTEPPKLKAIGCPKEGTKIDSRFHFAMRLYQLTTAVIRLDPRKNDVREFGLKAVHTTQEFIHICVCAYICT